MISPQAELELAEKAAALAAVIINTIQQSLDNDPDTIKVIMGGMAVAIAYFAENSTDPNQFFAIIADSVNSALRGRRPN